MPRIKEDTTRLVAFRVSEGLYDRFQKKHEGDERTVSAALRYLMRKDLGEVHEAGRKRAA